MKNLKKQNRQRVRVRANKDHQVRDIHQVRDTHQVREAEIRSDAPDLPECDEMGVVKGTNTLACGLIFFGALAGVLATIIFNI